MTAVNLGTATVKDGAGNAANLSWRGGTNPAGTLQIRYHWTSCVSSVVASGTGITAGAGDLGVGSVVTLTLNLTSMVTVAGGTPTLTLNDGGTATYSGGSGTNALTSSTIRLGPARTPLTLAVTAVNLGAATVRDSAGNAANLSGAVTNPAGTLQIDTTAPTVSSVVASGNCITGGAGAILGRGRRVTLTVNLGEAGDGCRWHADADPQRRGHRDLWAGALGRNALTFSYTVGAGQNITDLAVSGGQSRYPRPSSRRRRQCRQPQWGGD